MPRLLNLLLIFSVLWCGLHLMEPAGTAPGLVDLAHSEAASVPGECHDGGGGSGNVAHSSHHHCPSAPVQRLASGDDMTFSGETLFFAALTVPLASLSQAPPLEPPTA